MTNKLDLPGACTQCPTKEQGCPIECTTLGDKLRSDGHSPQVIKDIITVFRDKSQSIPK